MLNIAHSNSRVMMLMFGRCLGAKIPLPLLSTTFYGRVLHRRETMATSHPSRIADTPAVTEPPLLPTKLRRTATASPSPLPPCLRVSTASRLVFVPRIGESLSTILGATRKAARPK